jgi:transcription antitermination factor NusA-like protein
MWELRGFGSLKLPICSFDAKVGVLCPKCEAKLRNGELSRTDVDVSYMLAKNVAKFPVLDRITLRKAVEVDGDLVLLVGQGDMSALRADPDFARRLEENLGRKVWFTEGEADDRKFVEHLLHPARIMTMNTVWLPDGSKIMKVIIPGRRTGRFPVDLEKVKRIVKETRGIELVIKFEREERP